MKSKIYFLYAFLTVVLAITALTLSESTLFAAAQENWTDLFQISNQPDTYWNSPRISGNGKWVVFKEGFNTFLAQSDGGDLHQIDLLGRDSFPDISADGGKVVAVRACAVRLHEGGATRSLTPCVSSGGKSKCLCADKYVAALSGNGRWLFYVSDDPWPCQYVDDAWQCSGNLDGSREVWRIDTASGAVTQVTDFDTGEDTGAFWVSSDFTGSKIAFTAGTDDDVSLYSVNGNGSNRQKLAQVRPGPTSYTHRNIAFISGNGEWIVFSGKDAEGHSELDIIRSDGSERRVIRPGYGCDHGPLGTDCGINYNGEIISVGTLVKTTEILDNQGHLLDTIHGEEVHLAYDGMQITTLSSRKTLGLGDDTDEQVFTMKRGVTKKAPITATAGSQIAYTVTLHHGDQSTLSADLTDPIPNNATYVPNSVQASIGAANYDAAQQQIVWNGNVAPGEIVTVTFAVTSTCDTSPPPERLENQATVTLGSTTFYPLAVTAIELPAKDLAALSDSPANGANDVLIEAGGVGPLLQWRDQAAGLSCGTGVDDAVAYKVYLRKETGSWQEVGAYPNCSRRIQLSKNALSCQENGDPALYAWKVVAYDPAYPCREAVESVFDFHTASCRPALDIEPKFKLDSAYFLNNQQVNNVIKVTVDWNGPAYQTPAASSPYGEVYFSLNGTETTESGQSWGAEHTYNMGGDFNAAFSCANNTLQVWAVNADGFEAKKTVIQPTVFPWPGWVDWLEDLHLGSFSTEEQAPLVEYTYNYKYPEEPFEAAWTPPGWIPYLGGHPLGILETQAEASAEGKSDGSGSAGVSGQTGLGLGAVDVDGSLSGRGEAQFTCGQSLDLTGAELNFSIHAAISQEAGVVDVIPAVRAAEKWPVVGRIIRWVNNSAQVKATLTPGVDISTRFRAQNNQLEFDSGEGTGSIDIQVELSTAACEDLTANLYGGGTPYITVQVPKNPGYLKEVGVDLYYGAAFQAWEFETEYERKINCHNPGTCTEVSDDDRRAVSASAWRLLPRPDSARVKNVPVLRATGAATETVLLSPSYVRPEPALALRADGLRLLTYVHDDTDKPHGRGTEIYAQFWNGNWNGAVPLTDDRHPDFAPAVTFDGSGNGVLLWERATLPVGVTPTLNITFAQSLEIVARTWMSSTGSWGSVTTLTVDSLMDYAPRLSTGADGSVMALWQNGDGEDIMGTAAHPITLTYAAWDGSAWSAPASALTGLHDVLGVAFAAYSSTQAALVYAVDGDGILTTTHDSELYYAVFDGASWSAPTRLTNDGIGDILPALAYDATGSRYLVWRRGGDLLWLKDSWDVNSARTVRHNSAEGGFMGFQLSRAPAGNLALVWQGMGDSGANLTYSIYDAPHNSWAADNTLMNDEALEAAPSVAFGSDAALYLAYHRLQTERITRTFSTASTTFTVTDFITPGQSSLVFAEHTIGRDLRFDSLSVSPPNPAPGQALTLTAVLRNAGDLAIANPQVAFYDGSAPILTRTLPITLAAGYTVTAQITYTLPSPAVAHTFKAVADPNGQVLESNESNNEVATQTTLPDLRVPLLYAGYSAHSITLTARLANAGVLSATVPFTLAFRAADPITGTLLGSVPVTESLDVGAHITLTLTLSNPASLVGAGDRVWVTADDGANVPEADETNNTVYARLAVLPDLRVTAQDISSSNPVTITIHNGGVITATSPVVAVRQGGLTGTLIYSDALNNLAAGASAMITVTLSPTHTELWVKADPDNLIAESDESNNLATVERALKITFNVYLPLIMKH